MSKTTCFWPPIVRAYFVIWLLCFSVRLLAGSWKPDGLLWSNVTMQREIGFVDLET